VIYLPDANLLISASLTNHVHHKSGRKWFNANPEFATTPITELALIRVAMHRNYGVSFADAMTALKAIKELPNHVFWPANLEVSGRLFNCEVASGNTTDAYLLALARSMGGKLATFDQGIGKIAQGSEAHLEVLVP